MTWLKIAVWTLVVTVVIRVVEAVIVAYTMDIPDSRFEKGDKDER